MSSKPAPRDVVVPIATPLRHVREAFDRSVALVLGVNDYTHGVPRLKTAVPDAEAVGALLETQHRFTKLLRRDAQVTGATVRALFDHELADEIGGELTERDRLLVYFAGHGVSLPSDHGPEGRLLFADADAADPGSFFAMSELRKLISALPCRHVLIVLDCCFAGTFRWAGHGDGRHVTTHAYRETLDRFVQYCAWQVLVSASHDQVALDAASPRRTTSASAPEVIDALAASRIETEGHSPFAAALLRGLQGAADYTRDGLIIAAELELYVRDAVEKSTQVQQTPQLYKLAEHDRGEFVFQVPGTTLALEPAPGLSLAVCPYQGLRPYSSAERDRFFGRTHVVAKLVDQVKAHLGLPRLRGHFPSLSRHDGGVYVVEYAVFDEAGRPTQDKYGVVGWRSKLDERGNPIEVAYFTSESTSSDMLRISMSQAALDRERSSTAIRCATAHRWGSRGGGPQTGACSSPHRAQPRGGSAPAPALASVGAR